MKLERVTQVFERFIFRLSLTRHIDFNALSHEPIVLLPNAGCKFLFHKEAFYLPLVGDPVVPLEPVRTINVEFVVVRVPILSIQEG